MIKYALKSNTLICAVDFGDGIREGYMESISKPSGGSYNHIYGTKEFPDVFEDIYKRIKNYYVVDYTPNSYGKKLLNLNFVSLPFQLQVKIIMIILLMLAI